MRSLYLTNKKVIVHLSGGLGNQMFQYMAGADMAKNSGNELVINLNWFLNPKILNRSNSVYLTKRRCDILQFENVADTKVDWLPTPRDGRMERLIALMRSWCISLPGVTSEINFSIAKAERKNKTKRLFGFFMSPKFFSNVDPKTIFSGLKSPLSEWSYEMQKLIKSETSVGVHIRLGDYVSLGDKVIPSESYFLSGIEYLVSILGSESKIYFFSDEPQQLKSLFPKLISRGVIISPPNHVSSVENLIVLSSCAAYVCSNSTYSWWGAALSDAPESLIVRPSFFYTATPGEDSHADLWGLDSTRLHPVSGEKV